MTGDGLLAHRVERARRPAGDGEPLLLLNGGMMTYAAWDPVSNRLRDRHRLVLCDLRGQLRSPGPVPPDLAANVADLTALLDHLGIDAVHLLGTSYGGALAVLMAALEPRRVRSLIAVTVGDHADAAMQRRSDDWRAQLAGAGGPDGRGRFYERLIAAIYSDDFRRRHAAELAERAAQVAALPETWFSGLRGILAAVANFDLRPHLGAVRAPALIVLASADRLMPAERSLALAAAIPGAETRIHETSGHGLVAEDPAWLARVAREFLARHARTVAADRSPT